MAAAATLIVSAVKAAACRMRSCPQDTCSQAGMAWPAQSLPNTVSLAASWGSDRRRPAWMR
jgi:hypothetical protein